MGFPTLRRRPHKLPAHTVKDHSSTRKLPPQLAAQSISPQRAAHLTPLSSSVNSLNLPLPTSPPPPTHFLSSGPRILRACGEVGKGQPDAHVISDVAIAVALRIVSRTRTEPHGSG